MNLSSFTDAKFCQAYIHQFCESILAKEQPNIINEKRDISLTYGEIFFESMQKIFKKFPLNVNDIFLDCGSGFGKVAAQTFLMTKVNKVIGIEIDSYKYKVAQLLLIKMQEQIDQIFYGSRNLTFIQGDITKVNIQDATVVYTCSTCFTEQLVWSLGEYLNTLPNLRLLLSLKPIPSFEKLPYYGIIPVECSWDSALCYVYKR